MVADAKTANISLEGNNTNVDILITKQVEHVMDKQISQLPVPKQGGQVFNIDIVRLKQIITINGILEDTNAKSGLTKKNDLLTLVKTAGTYTLAWGTGATAQSYTGSIQKILIRESQGRTGDEGSQDKTFEVTLSFFPGTFRG